MTHKLIENAIRAALTLTLVSTANTTIAATNSTNNSQPSQHTMGDIQGMEKCYGVAKSGMNDCSTDNNTCAGASNTDNSPSAWILVPSGTCKKIVGGKTEPGDHKS